MRLKPFDLKKYAKYTEAELEVIHYATIAMRAILTIPDDAAAVETARVSSSYLRSKFHPEPYKGSPRVRENHSGEYNRPGDRAMEQRWS